MQDFSSVNIKNMIIHNVGNKVKGESLDLSTEICDTNNKVTNQYLKQFFFSTFKFDITYRFVHETDIAMNEIYNYVKHIFDNSDQFYEQSVNIAKHLYEVSVHPNIKAGELCIVYLQNCIIDDNVTDAVGIYKSESKDYYLQVNSTENGYDIECQQGINPKKLDKGCLIFNSSDSNYKVCVVDKNVNDAMYWKKLFLMIEEEKNEYVNTSKTLKSCKRYIAKNEDLEPKKKLELINNSVEYFENNDEFDLEKFSEKVFNNKEESDKFKVYLDSYEIDNKFSISSNAVTKIKKTIKKPSTIYIIRPLTQAVKQNGIDQTDQKCKGPVRVTHNKEKSSPFIPQHIQIQLVIHGNFPDFFNVKRSQSGSTGNKDRLRCFSRDEKSRTFSSNSRRSHILRTSSRSIRLILSSIVSLAVWLKCTRTI